MHIYFISLHIYPWILFLFLFFKFYFIIFFKRQNFTFFFFFRFYYMCSPSWTLLPPPSPYHPSGSSQCTSPKHPVSCIELGLASRFIHDILHVSMPFSQIFPPSPSPTKSIRLFYTSVSLLLSRTQGYCYRLSKFHICVSILYWCFSFWLTSLCIIGSSFIHLIRTDSNVFFLMAE